jgi:hypothetical protein
LLPYMLPIFTPVITHDSIYTDASFSLWEQMMLPFFREDWWCFIFIIYCFRRSKIKMRNLPCFNFVTRCCCCVESSTARTLSWRGQLPEGILEAGGNFRQRHSTCEVTLR